MIKHLGIKMPWTHLDIFASRLPASVRNPHAHNVGLSTVGDHALALRGCESGLDQFDHHVHREPVRTQDRLGVTVTAPGKQFEGAAAVRIGTAIVASGRHRCTVTISPRPAAALSRAGRDLLQHRRRRGHRGQLTNAALAAWFGTRRYTRVKESPGRAGALRINEEVSD
jgi:hypothetical protein